MSLNFKQALTYIKDDGNWVKKVIIGGLFMLAMAIFNTMSLDSKTAQNVEPGFILAYFLLFLVAIITNIFATGYYLKTSTLRMHNKPEALPEWEKYGELFVTGIKFHIGYALFYIPFIVISVILGILAATMVFSGNIPGAVVMGILIVLLLILLGVLSPLMITNFVKEYKILSAANVFQATKLLKNNMKNYIMLFLYGSVLGIFTTILTFILTLTIIGVGLIPFLSFYVTLVYADLIAQFGKTKIQPQA